MSATLPRIVVKPVPSLALLGALILWCWWRIRLLGDVRGHLDAFYLWFTVAFASYLAALWLVHRQESQRRRVSFWSLGLVLLVAVFARLLLVGLTPTLSDDIYRYHWDGRVQEAGIDPYAYAPNDPALAPLRDATWPLINFPNLRTVYPPLTELAFRAGMWLGETVIAQKILFVCAEALIVLSLGFLLWRRGQSLLWIAAYAWHPLAILEIAGSGHNDALGVALLWAGVAAWEARRYAGVAAAWTLTFLSKYSTVILVPWWWARRTARTWLIVFCVLAALPLILHPTIISAVIQSLTAMTGRGSSNAFGYLAFQTLFGARIAPLVVLGLWGLFLIWQARREADPIRYVGRGFAFAALLAPALHPWYLMWLIPCFCFWRPRPLLWLTGAVVLAYTVWPGYLAGGPWALPLWARLLEYLPVLLLGAWQLNTSVTMSQTPRRVAACPVES